MDYCRECHLVLPLSCGRQVLPCPPPLAVDPAKDVLIHCTTCKKTWAMPVSKVVSGKTPRLKMCPTSKCDAVLLHPKDDAIAPRQSEVTKKPRVTKNGAAPKQEGE
jgi:hypothetical protein